MGKIINNQTLIIVLGAAAIIYLISKSKNNTRSFIKSDIEAQEGFMADNMGKIVVPVNSYNFYDK